MSGLPDALEKRIGPFPVYGWLLIIVAGVGVGIALNRFLGEADDSVADETSDMPLTEANIGPAFGGTSGPTFLRPAPFEERERQTNDTWIDNAIRQLVGGGFATGFKAQQVIQKYTEGGTLTADEQALVDKAISILGPPPEGAPVMLPPEVVTAPAAPSSPTPPPPTPAPAVPSAQLVPITAVPVTTGGYVNIGGRQVPIRTVDPDYRPPIRWRRS